MQAHPQPQGRGFDFHILHRCRTVPITQFLTIDVYLQILFYSVPIPERLYLWRRDMQQAVESYRTFSGKADNGKTVRAIGRNFKFHHIPLHCQHVLHISTGHSVAKANISQNQDTVLGRAGHFMEGDVYKRQVLDSALTVYDNLESRAALYHIFGQAFRDRLAALADKLEFKDLLKRTVGKLSGGQRRRIDIARALLHRPKLLILDEPTTGLDPQTRKILWDVISDLRKNENLTVFLTTHYMEEAAEADYVVILDSGKISAQGTPLELKNTYTGDYITLYGVSEEDVRALGIEYTPVRDAYRLFVPNTAAAKELILQNSSLFTDFEITKGKMDDVFLAVTGKNLLGGFEK